MKKLNLIFLIALVLSSCQSAAPIHTLAPVPTKTATPTPMHTSTPVPKIYTLRIEFSTTSDWSNLSILDSSSVKGVQLVDKQGDLIDYSVEKTYLAIKQTSANAQALKEVSMTVDYYIAGNTTSMSIPFLLGKGAINNSTIRFYNVLNGTKYLLLDEVQREGSVAGHEDVNPYKFSFDLEPLFQEVALLPTPTIIPTPLGGGSGRFIFEYYKAAYEKSFPGLGGEMHVFTSNWDGSNLTPITSELGNLNHIEDLSADGQMALVSSHSSYQTRGELYLIHLNSPNSTPAKLADGLAWSRWPQAIFLDNTRVAFVGRGREFYGRVYTINIDGTNPKKLGYLLAEFGGLLSSDQSRIYYKGWTKSSFTSLWWMNIDGSRQGKLESNGHQILPNEFFYIGTGEGAVFSPDGTKIAWIPNELEQGCSYLYLALWTPDIRNGAYTKFVTKYADSEYKNSPHVGKVIDTAYVEDYVRHCFMLHIASLSDLDHDTEIPLIPPFDPNKDNFYYHKDYALKWWPDGSKILVFDNGSTMGRWRANNYYPITLYELSLEDPDPKLQLLKVLSNSSVAPGTGLHYVSSFGSFKISPDGRQILFTRYSFGDPGSMIRVLDVETVNYIDDFSHNITPDFLVQRVGDINWLP